VLADDAYGCAREVEFEECSAEAAVHLAQQVCRNREAEVFEGGRRLGSLKRAPRSNLWVVSV
jgi:hypothetical protein